MSSLLQFHTCLQEIYPYSVLGHPVGRNIFFFAWHLFIDLDVQNIWIKNFFSKTMKVSVSAFQPTRAVNRKQLFI